MRNLKRALSLALTSVMLLGMMVIGTSAASFPDVDADANTEAIEVLSAIGVLQGYDDGQYHPENPVTRNQMAAIICRLKGLDTNASGIYRPFADVPDWAAASVSACVAEGIITGRDDGLFHGDDTVTATEAASMMLRALGYTRMPVGDAWASAVAQKSSQIGLFDGISVSANTAMNRNAVAQLSLNTLESTLVDVDTEGGSVTIGDATVNLGATKYADRTGTTNKYKSFGDDANEGKWTLEMGEETFDGKLEKEPDVVDSLTGRFGTKWTYRGDVISTYSNEADRTYVVSDADKDITYFMSDSDYLGYASGRYAFVNGDGDGAGKSTLVVNGSTITYNNITTTKLQKGDVIEVFFYDEASEGNYARGDVQRVVVMRYQAAFIDEVRTNTTSNQQRDGVSALITLEDIDGNRIGGTYYDSVNITASSDEKDKELKGYSSSYTEGAAIAIARNGSKIIDSYPMEMVTGRPTSARNAEYVGDTSVIKNGQLTVNGTKYNFAGGMDGVKNNFDFDDDYNIYITKEGYALAIEGAEGVNLDDVYYVVGLYRSSQGINSNTWYAQTVALADGTIKSIKIDSDWASESSNANIKAMLVAADAGYKVANGTLTGTTGVALAPNTLYVTKDYLYTFDKDGIPTKWDGNNEKDYQVVPGTLTDDFTSSSTRIEVGGSRYYVSGTTQFINVEKVGDDLTETKTAAGNMSSKKTIDTVLVKDGSNAVYVLYIGKVSGVSRDVVYLADRPNTTAGDDKWEAKLYDMTTGEQISGALVDKNTYSGNTFYTYSINSDNVYELTTIATTDDERVLADEINGSNFLESDAKGAIFAMTISTNNGNQLTGTFNLSGTKTVKQADATNARIYDDRDDAAKTAPLYTEDIASIKDLTDALKLGQLTADVFVTDGDISFIYVTDMDEKDPTADVTFTLTDTPAAGSGNAISGGGATKTVTVTVVNTTASVKITGTKTAAQRVTVGGTDGALVTAAGTDTAPTYTLNTDSIKAEGGSMSYTLTVAEDGKNSITYTVNVTVLGETADVGFALTTPTADDDNTIVVDQEHRTVAVNVVNTTASVKITGTKVAAQSVAKGGTDAAAVTVGADDTAPTFTVDTTNTTDISTTGGDKTFTIEVTQTGYKAVTYTVTVTVAEP